MWMDYKAHGPKGECGWMLWQSSAGCCLPGMHVFSFGGLGLVVMTLPMSYQALMSLFPLQLGSKVVRWFSFESRKLSPSGCLLKHN